MNKWFLLLINFAFFTGGYIVGWLMGRKAAREETRLLFNLADRLLTHVLREKMNYKDPLGRIIEEAQNERKER